MSKIGKIDVIREFGSDDKIYGIYSVMFNDKQEIFIKNGDSIGTVQHYLGVPAGKCVSEIRDDVKEEFLSKLKEIEV